MTWNINSVATIILCCYCLVRTASPSTCRNRFLPADSQFRTAQCTNCTLFHQFAPTILQSDPRYDELRRNSLNLLRRSDAAYIVLPGDSDSVVRILRHAIARKIRPTVRSGGHCYVDFWSNNTDGVLIDMQSMNKIYRDKNGTVWIEPGVKLEQLYSTLYKRYGQVLPAGLCLDVGMGGHVLGGGYGYLVRKHGILSDYVHFFELAHVNATGGVNLVLVGRNSSVEKDRNLYWALRGGGQQNFGVVTKFGFRDLPKSPPVVYKYEANFTLNGEIDKKAYLSFLTKYTQFAAQHSAPGDEFCNLFIDLLVGRKRSHSYLWLRVTLFGEDLSIVDRFMNIVGLNTTKFSCEKMSYYKLSFAASFKNDITRDGDYFVRRSAYMVAAMPPNHMEVLWHYMTDPGYAYVDDTNLQIRPYGCAVSRFAETDTAYVHRKAILKLQSQTVWEKSEDTQAHLAWARQFYRAMYGEYGPRPDGVMDGSYVSYPDDEVPNGQWLYYKNNYNRLKQVKAQWDPLNIFHHRQSIEINGNLMK